MPAAKKKAAAKPAAKPAAAPVQGNGSEIRLSGAYITGYSYFDNNPPGSAAISNPVIHQRAGGTGTFADPITVAINVPQFPWGTKFYIPNLRAYFIAEDTIGDSPGTPPHLDVWVGGQSSSESSADSCMSRLTGNYLVIRNPASNYAVVSGPLSANNGCRQLFGNTVVTSGGAPVSAPAQPAPAQPAPQQPKPPAAAPTKPSQPSSPPVDDDSHDRSDYGGSDHHRRHDDSDDGWRDEDRWRSEDYCHW